MAKCDLRATGRPCNTHEHAAPFLCDRVGNLSFSPRLRGGLPFLTSLLKSCCWTPCRLWCAPRFSFCRLCARSPCCRPPGCHQVALCHRLMLLRPSSPPWLRLMLFKVLFSSSSCPRYLLVRPRCGFVRASSLSTQLDCSIWHATMLKAYQMIIAARYHIACFCNNAHVNNFFQQFTQGEDGLRESFLSAQ